MKSNISSDMNKPCWKLAKACPQSQKLFCFGENNLLVITEQFQEYLLWKLFIVKTSNNLLTYIMTTPNLDATQHCWVESFGGLTLALSNKRDATMQPQMP